MAKYIPLDAVLAEIKRLRGAQPLDAFQPKEQNKIDWLTGKLFTINSLEVFINSLEVKEVDLEKELIEWHKEHFKKDGTFIGMSGFYLTNNSQMDIAKHFFELGVNASNPLTWEDISDIDDLLDESLPSSFGDELELKGYYEEVLKRFKSQKGEKV